MINLKQFMTDYMIQQQNWTGQKFLEPPYLDISSISQMHLLMENNLKILEILESDVSVVCKLTMLSDKSIRNAFIIDLLKLEIIQESIRWEKSSRAK